jgi:hypothetical protein
MAHWQYRHHKHHNLKRYWWVIVLVIVLCLFFLKVPYDTFPTNAPLTCENGELKLISQGSRMWDLAYSSMTDISRLADGFQCATLAGGDSSVYSQVKCINDQPTTICTTQLYKAILMGKITFTPIDKKITASEIDYEEKCLEACPDGLDKRPESMFKEKGYSLVEGGAPAIFCLCANGDTYTIDLDKK